MISERIAKITYNKRARHEVEASVGVTSCATHALMQKELDERLIEWFLIKRLASAKPTRRSRGLWRACQTSEILGREQREDFRVFAGGKRLLGSHKEQVSRRGHTDSYYLTLSNHRLSIFPPFKTVVKNRSLRCTLIIDPFHRFKRHNNWYIAIQATPLISRHASLRNTSLQIYIFTNTSLGEIRRQIEKKKEKISSVNTADDRREVL